VSDETPQVVWGPEPSDPQRSTHRFAHVGDGIATGYVHQTTGKRPWLAYANSDMGPETRHRTQEIAMAACEKRMAVRVREHLEEKRYRAELDARLKAQALKSATEKKEMEMSDPRAAGIKVEILRRFGNHRGPTEWEITVENEEAKALIRSLPRMALVDHSTKDHVDDHANWLMLPEGTTPVLAGEIAACLACLDEDALVAALHRAGMEGATTADFKRLTDRCLVWMSGQDVLTTEQMASALTIDKWRAVSVIARLAGSGRLTPLDDGTSWRLTPEEKHSAMRLAKKAEAQGA
jgi:hypothetical protein